MFILEAPSPGYQTTVILPSPQWGDSTEVASTVETARAMDGTAYTYVKQRGGRHRYQFAFELSRNKSLELRAFIQAYYGTPMRFTPHDTVNCSQTVSGVPVLAYLQNNPFEFAGKSRAVDFPGGETMTVELGFEEAE